MIRPGSARQSGRMAPADLIQAPYPVSSRRDFGGGVVSLAIRQLRPTGVASGQSKAASPEQVVIHLRTSSFGIPQKGAVVAISVRDAAHIF